MSTRPLLGLVVLLAVVVIFGGQRLLSSSFGRAWFPSRDVYPNDPLYVFDRFDERIDLMFSAAGDERLELCLQFAHEKFLEAVRMVHINEPGHAWIAAGLHEDYLIRGAREVAGESELAANLRRARYISALIERVNILADIYPELPQKVRVFSLIPLVGTLLEHYDQQRSDMPENEIAAYNELRDTLRNLVERMKDADHRSVRREQTEASRVLQL